MFNLMNRFTLDSIGEIGFGADIGSLEDPSSPFLKPGPWGWSEANRTRLSASESVETDTRGSHRKHHDMMVI